ncbi:MAG: fibronectin type III domain-containing protein [Clostridia bacterium]|nr:fibronectin type III domain-containing protein [Clostridia bacterium]
MKKIISFFLSIIIIICGFSILSTVSFAEKAKAEKVGYVCTKEVYKGSDGYTETITRTYDSKGNMTKYGFKSRYADFTETYTYDSKGNLTKLLYKEPSGYSSTTTYTYDSKGNLTKRLYKDTYGRTGTMTNTYDSKGNLTKYVYKAPNGETETKSYTYTYDSKGNMTKQVYKNPYGETETTTYTYDSKGNLTKKAVKYSDGDTYTTTYTYDSKGNLTKKVGEDSDGDTYTTTYTYDSKGNLTKKVGEYNTYTYTYDSKGNLTKEVNDNATYTYTYDSKGNLTRYVYKDSYYTYTITYTYDSKGNMTKEARKNAYTKTYEYAKASKTVYEAEVTENDAETKYQFVYNGAAQYTGKAVCPAVSVFAGGRIVNSKGVDYTVTYKNNTKIGTAYMILTFNNQDETQVILPFKIARKSVTGLKATPATTSIKLNWTKYTGAKYYKVEQSTDGKTWKKLGTVSTNTYTVKSLKAGKKYQYRVTALDSSKKEFSKASAVLKTGTLTAAPAVTLKSAKSKTATASWKKVTGASKYIVYKSTNGKKWTKVTATTKLTYTLTKLTGGKKIYVKVYAVNAYGKNSAASTVKSVTVKK